MPTNGTLYVFVHGLTVARERREIEIVLPRVPGHVYRAGSWLMETPIAPGAILRLQGVTRVVGSPLFPAPLMINLTGCSLTHKYRAATLWLPRPRRIVPLLIAQDPNLVVLVTSVGGSGFAGGSPLTQMASIQVYEYDYPDENQLSLDGHYWEPYSIGGATSLHIISTSIEDEGFDHLIDTDRVLRHVIQNYPVIQFARIPQGPAPSWQDTTNPLYGLIGTGLITSGESIVPGGGGFAFAQAELEGIPSRTVRVNNLGRIKQQGRPVGTLWHEPAPLTGTDCTCGQYSCP